MKRAIVPVAGVLALAHAVCLAVLPSASSRIYAGNLVRLAALALTILALVLAYRRSAGFVRIVLTALGAAFVPAIIRIVYQAFFDLHHISGFPYFVLLFLHIVPPLAILLLPERIAHYRDLWPYALDIVQLGIALGSFYFLFYYPLHQAGATPASMALLIQVRNYVLIGALPVRILLSRKASVRDVLTRLFAVTAVMQFDLLMELPAGRELGVYTGSRLDFLGTVIIVAFPIILFALLPASADPYVQPESRPSSFTLRAHVVPAVLPVAVWLMGISATHEHRTLALVLASAAALCYGTRWYVVQHQASRDALQLWISERRLRALTEAFSQRDRDAFFQSITVMLCRTLAVKYALIAEYIAGEEERINTLAVAEGAKPAPNFSYGLRDTPCAHVIAKGFAHFESGVAKQFPADEALAAMGADSYMGICLYGPTGAALGLLTLIHDRPLADADVARSFLQICSTPVGIELERWRTEEGLRSTEQKIAFAFSQSPNGVAIIDATDETYQEVNDSFAALYGAPKEEIIGRTSVELNTWVDPEDRRRALAELKKKGRIRNFEFLGRTRSGEIKTLQGSGDAIDFRGKQLLLVTLRDVTLERAAEKALQKSEKKYRDLFQNANDFIFTLDFSGHFLSMNRKGEALTGLTGVEPLEHSFEDVIVAGGRPRFRENLALVIAGENPGVFEVVLDDKGAGTTAPVLEVALRLVSQDGEPVAVQGIARDVSDRRILEKKFLQMQKLQAVGTLAGGIAHDFNNLLTVITGYVHLVMAQLSGDSSAREDVAEIGKATERAASLTRQLLTFSRQHVTHREPLNLNDSVRGMEKMLRRLLGENVQLASNLQPSLPRVLADAGQMDQVILNLAVNARDAMPAGGRLEFRTSAVNLSRSNSELDLAPGGYVVMEVADSGVGMNETTQSRIFEPFYTTKDVGKGTGLGLSTVYGIVQDCGGHIGVKSRLGKGTTFTIHFPAIPSQQESPEPGEDRLREAQGSETILLVEDDAAIRNLAAKILETSGYRVLTAHDAGSARGLLDDSGTAIDLMVTDVMLPGGGGVELAQHAEAVRPRMKSFYISGNAAGQLPAGAILLQKPFSPIELAVRIRTILDESR